MTLTEETEALGRDVIARLDALRPDQVPQSVRDNMADLLAQFTDLADEAELITRSPGSDPTTRQRAREHAATCREIIAQLTRLNTPQTQTRKENNQ